MNDLIFKYNIDFDDFVYHLRVSCGNINFFFFQENHQLTISLLVVK